MMIFTSTLSSRRFKAVVFFLLIMLFISGCRSHATSGNAKVPEANTSKAQAKPSPTPGVNIYVDEAMLSKPYAVIGGTVENISGEKLENLSVEIELKRRDDGTTERREVAVQPGSLDPGRRGKYSLKVLSDEWSSSRVVRLRGDSGDRDVAFKSLPGAKRPLEKPDGSVIIVKTPPRKKSNGDEFINTPDTAVSVP